MHANQGLMINNTRVSYREKNLNKMSYEASVMEQAMETARKRVLESYDEDG